ncbi:MAG: bifunctional diaminohydroxyphosphoribosylaminopyrimidine deaminase/5-amino-6-(5-phosphoribosylamino)uracil reductase RibD [Erythrobacter sp.]
MSSPRSDDDAWMAATTRLAGRARPLCSPNPGVAALIVKEGRVIARGWTQSGGRPHAEAVALSQIEGGDARGMTVYVSLEPCAHRSERGPSCTDLLIKAAPERVVIGIADPDPRTSGQGQQQLEQAGIKTTLLNHKAARDSLAGYLTKRRLNRPFVTLKLAMSIDGCIALADGSSEWITGEQARAHVHAQRARNDAILVGGGTWRADNPRLDVRLPGLEDRSPKRILLTRGVAPDGVTIINRPDQIESLDGINYLYVEGGAQAAASFLKDDLVDEIHLYRAPILIGDGLRGLGPLELEALDATHGRWLPADNRQLGSDQFTAYLRQR